MHAVSPKSILTLFQLSQPDASIMATTDGRSLSKVMGEVSGWEEPGEVHRLK